MRKIVVTFGLISGAISSLIMIALVTFGDRIGFDRGAVIGNTSIVLSFLMVFFGVRTYRDNIGNGQITFLESLCRRPLHYSGFLHLLCRNVGSDLLQLHPCPWDAYGAHLVEKLTASGANPAAIQAKLEQVRKYKELYKNPLFNAALTFIDPFPIGLVITLISALVLRRKPRSLPEQSPLRAS